MSAAGGATALEALERAYLAHGKGDPPVHREDSEWVPLVDGVEYLTAVRAAADATGPGDVLYVVGLQLDPDVDLAGRRPGDPRYEPVAETLASAAARGVDVRVIVAGSVYTAGLPLKLGPFPGNLRSALRLRAWRPQGHPAEAPPPLENRVLLDWSGHRWGTNHQKAVVVTHGAELTTFVSGMDIAAHRFDGPPHDTMRRADRPWGWHDAGGRLRGPAARTVWENVRHRWREAISLPRRPAWLGERRVGWMNPAREIAPPDPGPAPAAPPVPSPGRSVQVLRSFGPWKHHRPLPMLHRRWTHLPERGVFEVYETLATAIDAARELVYVEDQYFREYLGGDRRFELYAHLRDAAARGVRVLLVGSGVRRPDDVNAGLANRELPADIAKKVVAALPPEARRNVALFRVEGVTVHSKVVLVDDRFACIGSANLFSRSMAGTDHELSVAIVDAGDGVRDLRVRLWSDHLRLDPSRPDVAEALADLPAALGAWRPEWAGHRRDDPPWEARPGDPRRVAESPVELVGP